MAKASPTTKASAGTIEKRLSRIAGQVAGVQKMVAERRYCIDILTQVSAIRSALDAVAVEVLVDHVDHCLAPDKSNAHPHAGTRTREALVEELQKSLSRLVG